MSGFPAEWLSMREPYDHAARDPELVARLAERVGDRALSLVDLGCGLGSNLRYVAPRLSAPQRWILVDADPLLLAAIPEALDRWAHSRGEICTTTADGLRIGARLEVGVLLADLRDEDVAWPTVDVVTTQALLDLVSEGWLDRLADHLVQRRTPLLAALTVDGRLSWSPADPDDTGVHASFRAHQHTDRGFGPSPGPLAAERLATRLSAAGFAASSSRADWAIPAADRAMLTEMVTGIAHAAAEMDPDPRRVEAWRDRRLASISAGTTGLDVGHLDLLALPIDPR